ncbi:MAG TPA: phage portal protein [Sphingopyxis sp.]|nr:phage portal protein [Sphingopyxis sp.]HMP43912.1 phage portal protein [Sphingopyxis sp.]HMQ18079.1 phage portal protein [Sphingopyxis sp.]
MGSIFRGLAERKSAPAIVPLKDAASLFAEMFGGRQSRSGATVTWSTALEVATVLGCAKVISEDVAQVPWKLFLKAEGRAEAKDHPLFEILYLKPNDWQTSFEFRETLALHAILTGNGYAYINRVRGEIAELIPYPPGAVEVKRAADMSLSYRVKLDGGDRLAVPASSMWHLRGPSWSSWLGMDSVRLAREAIGLAISAEESQGERHRDGLRYPGVYSVDGTLSPDEEQKLRGWLRRRAEANDPLVLDRGAKWFQQQMSGVDAQHIETRKHQVEEICRAFRVMPIMIGQADKAATYASAEQMFLAHVTYTLMPWFQRFEQSANANLLTREERRAGYYTKFNANALMRGAAKDRGEFYAKALGAGGQRPWMMADEVRDLEDMDPYGGHAAELGTGAMDTAPASDKPDDDPEQD